MKGSNNQIIINLCMKLVTCGNPKILNMLQSTHVNPNLRLSVIRFFFSKWMHLSYISIQYLFHKPNKIRINFANYVLILSFSIIRMHVSINR